MKSLVNRLVRVTKRINGHRFEIGQIVKIMHEDIHNNGYLCRDLQGNNMWILGLKEMQYSHIKVKLQKNTTQ